MNKIKLIVNRLLQLGTEKVSPELKSFIVLTNLNGITYFALDLILAVIFYYIIGDMHVSIAHICAAFAFLICSLGFNFMGWTNASRLSTVMIGSLLVVCCALYLGPQSFATGTLLLGAIFPFVYFSLSERKWVIISASFPVIGYILLIATNYHVGPQVGPLSETSLLLLRCIFFIFPLAGIIMNCYTAVSESNKKTEVLAESKKVIE